MNGWKLFWGIALVAAGVLTLLDNFNVLQVDVWDQIWKLWPLALIVAGLAALRGDQHDDQRKN